MNRPLIMYHKNCWDGFCAAWLFHLVFADAEFVPAPYGDAPPDCTGRRVFIADFSYKRAVLFDIAHRAKSLTVLDHHQTAQADLAGFAEDAVNLGYCPNLPTIVFDMEKSGGHLTLDYLQANAYLQPEVWPWLVHYTEARDLWKFNLPYSREINAVIRSFPLDFTVWDNMANHGAHAYIAEGVAILRRERQIIAEHVAHAYEIELAGHRVPCVNATTLFSDIAGELAIGKPFAVAYFIRADGKRQYSLRSDANGVNVAAIAARFGGGGHKHAAGFTELANFGSHPSGM